MDLNRLPLDPDVPDETAGARPLHLRAAALALVFVGGAIGTGLRYAIEVGAPAREGRWPTGTFIANLVGAFVLGVLLEALARAGDDTGLRRRARLLIGTGVCGGLTTYSTFAVETDLLVRSHDTGLAVAYALTSVIVGLFVTLAGIAAAARTRRGRGDAA